MHSLKVGLHCLLYHLVLVGFHLFELLNDGHQLFEVSEPILGASLHLAQIAAPGRIERPARKVRAQTGVNVIKNETHRLRFAFRQERKNGLVSCFIVKATHFASECGSTLSETCFRCK